MSKKDQASKGHNWKKRVKDWLLIPQSSTYGNPHNVSLDELAKHHTRTDCWMAIDGYVYDVSRFVPYHPGGPKILEMYAGRDATVPFSRNHMTSSVLSAIENFRVGRLLEGDEDVSEPATTAAPATTTSASQRTTASATPAVVPSVVVVPPSTSLLASSSPTTSASAKREADLAAAALIGLTRGQLEGVVQRSQLFRHLSPETVSSTIEEAVMSQTRGEVDDETALRELFSTLDTTSKGYVTRLALRDLLYRLEPDGVAEETLLRAPEQITFPVFLRLFKQL
ncbi:NADPH-hemoprotein reductase, putative [Bodo saltans]|uniref:NADPH-hemoprotein reductase, putative n=1 Tax=Bodo saltans TaxID=75058 RepID=A0A0S4KG28_BODSA|nr:NADPH-hemoprotein reductase, putative [Bodo saltans]|eukprot:CUI12357.1 NADPH-hemoprotein reductase, putative [Bodo saltans]